MEKNVIITISRQFGSNGREIARKLAEYLDISYYNKQILEKIAVNMGVCADFFKDQKQDANGLFTIESKGLLGLRNITELSVNTQIYDMASDFIQKISQREDAVIVGRCADYILKDNPDVISVFCYSDVEERIQWSIDEYQVPAKQAKKIVQEKDAQRSRFYEFYTNQKWGNLCRHHNPQIGSCRIQCSCKQISSQLIGSKPVSASRCLQKLSQILLNRIIWTNHWRKHSK